MIILCRLVGILGCLIGFKLHAENLCITLTPAAAVTAGAVWRVDGGAWQASGSTVASLRPGAHSISYFTLPGFTSPASESITLASDQSLSVNRAYSPYSSLNRLVVTLIPGAAKWRIDAQAWQSSGSSFPNLTPGNHTVDYAPYSGYLTPPSEIVQIVPGANKFTRTYKRLPPDPCELITVSELKAITGPLSGPSTRGGEGEVSCEWSPVNGPRWIDVRLHEGELSYWRKRNGVANSVTVPEFGQDAFLNPNADDTVELFAKKGDYVLRVSMPVGPQAEEMVKAITRKTLTRL